MKRLLIALGVVAVTLGGALAFMDGLSLRHELEYRDPHLTLGEPLSVSVQNVRQSGWGGALLESSTYGPPFDLYVFGTLPPDTPATSVALSGLRVTSDDGTTLLTVPFAPLPLADGETLRAGVTSANRTYSYEARAFTSATPPSITVSLELVFATSAEPRHQAITKQFHLNRIRRLSLGSHDWHF